MENINTYLNIFGQKTPKLTNKRQFVLWQIMEELKKEGNKSKPSYIAFRLSHLKVPDLEWVLHNGKEYKQRTGRLFSVFLFGSLKVGVDKSWKK